MHGRQEQEEKAIGIDGGWLEGRKGTRKWRFFKCPLDATVHSQCMPAWVTE